MMKSLSMIGVVAILAAPAAFAEMPKGSVTGYVTSTKLDLGSGGDDTGTGFGIRGWGTVSGPIFVHGEYQTVKTDDFDIKIDEFRIGGGFATPANEDMLWIGKIEYISVGGDIDPTQSGFGLHAGLILGMKSPLSGMVTVGYLSTDDTDGMEFNVGGKYAFTREWAGVLDYRMYSGSVDPSGDFKLSDIRLGVSYTFY